MFCLSRGQWERGIRLALYLLGTGIGAHFFLAGTNKITEALVAGTWHLQDGLYVKRLKQSVV